MVDTKKTQLTRDWNSWGYLNIFFYCHVASSIWKLHERWWIMDLKVMSWEEVSQLRVVSAFVIQPWNLCSATSTSRCMPPYMISFFRRQYYLWWNEYQSSARVYDSRYNAVVILESAINHRCPKAKAGHRICPTPTPSYPHLCIVGGSLSLTVLFHEIQNFNWHFITFMPYKTIAECSIS